MSRISKNVSVTTKGDSKSEEFPNIEILLTILCHIPKPRLYIPHSVGGNAYAYNIEEKGSAKDLEEILQSFDFNLESHQMICPFSQALNSNRRSENIKYTIGSV